MEVKIGLQHVPSEVVINAEGSSEDIQREADQAMAAGTPLKLRDEKGRVLTLNGSLMAYIVIGADEQRKVGFGV